jgi:hypothetical protein
MRSDPTHHAPRPESAPPAPTSGAAPRPAPPLVAAVLLAAFAAVYFEVVLLKLVAVTFYSIFVYAVIGVALLGYGAAGSLLAVRGHGTAAAAPRHMARAFAGFGLVVVPAFLAVNAIDVPMQRLFGTLAGLPLLLLVYACLTLPFGLIGLGLCRAFAAFPHDVNRLYFADLIGAGAGSALALASIPWIGGVPLVAAAGVVGGIAALLAGRAGGWGPRPAVGVILLDLVLLGVFVGVRPVPVRVASDKHGPILGRSAKPPGGLTTTFSRWSLFGRVDVTEPFATLPPQFGGDVSPTFGNLRIEQRMLTLDGAAPAFLYRVAGSPADMPFLGGTSQSPAYALRERPRVLVIGMGGATDVLIALHHGAEHVVAVELNPVTVTAVRDVYGGYLGDVLRDARVEVVTAEGRHFIAGDERRWDIVQLSGVDTGAAVGAYGLGTMPESYIYTVEAMHDLLARVAPGGVLSITRDLRWGWALRLSAIARAALAQSGLDPASRIAVLEGKGWGWATLLVKREPFTPAEAAVLEAFSARFDFPMLYRPLVPGTGAFDRVIREGAGAEEGADLRPATDEWPFFFLSARWRDLVGALRQRGNPLLNPIAFLLVSLFGLAVLAVALIGWPLWWLRAGWRTTPGKAALVGYFTALGAGFMLAEIALMQRFTIFLGNPVLAVGTVLAALLVTSGVGSWAARAWREAGRDPVPVAAGWIIALLVVYALPALPQLLRALLGAPLPVRLALTLALVALVGFPMGMPFPMGLARVSERSAPFVPWAWGINGLVSVLASLSSYLLGMMLGYPAMFYLGAALYGGALVLWRRL